MRLTYRRDRAAQTAEHAPTRTADRVIGAPWDVADLCDRYLEHAEVYYVKAGRRTSSLARIRSATNLLYRSGLTRCSASEFGPLRLQRFQQWLAGHPDRLWSRPTINGLVAEVVRMFQWAVSQELACPDTWQALMAVRGLRRGRGVSPSIGPPRENKRVRSAPLDRVELIRRRLPPMIAAMIGLQLATGMRPNELVGMRARDLRPTRDPRVWLYLVDPSRNKTDHHDIDKHVLIGPRGMELLRPWLSACGKGRGYVFTTAAARPPLSHTSLPDAAGANVSRAELHRLVWSEPLTHVAQRFGLTDRGLAAACDRLDVPYPSCRQRGSIARGVMIQPFRLPPDPPPPAAPEAKPYTREAYCRLIVRECDRVFEELYPRPPAKGAGEGGAVEALAEWLAARTAWRWHPSQLRHNRATTIRDAEGLDVAKLLLGHTAATTTLIYIDPEPEPKALAAAAAHG